MKWEKPDGTVEYGMSGCCCTPGPRRGGQHTNCGTEWWRVNTGYWFQPSQRFSQRDLRILAECAKTCVEFLDAVMELGPTEYRRLSEFYHRKER